jgi:hypothetical protein
MARRTILRVRITIFDHFAGVLIRASLIVSLKYLLFPIWILNDFLRMNKEVKAINKASSKYATKIPNAPADIYTKKNPVGNFIPRPIRSIIKTVLELEIPSKPKRATNSMDNMISNAIDIHVKCFIDSL